ncbi:unnamed protein product [Lactuca virosa]|uniref:Uncharacterized protein n=1 Tax=Lactuca virosa TaxID=75947 RepID=A0AAU9MS30_9ASTR|nr:unnamed protein product [Lactuca virosa]
MILHMPFSSHQKQERAIDDLNILHYVHAYLTLNFHQTGATTWLHELRTVEKYAVHVTTLRNCGAILLEKANMHEVGMGSNGIDDLIPTNNRVDVDDGYTYSGDANDTDFLNFDDDEAGKPDGEEIKMLYDSGWSSRTRAVAKYLQIMYAKEEGIWLV